MEDGENRSLLLVVSADVVSSVVESMKSIIMPGIRLLELLS